MPSLVPNAGSGCASPFLVSAWGDQGLGLAVDADGNVFAVMLKGVTTETEARGFAAAQIARGAAAVAGTPLFTLPGAGTTTAAMAPVAGADGILAFQPATRVTFDFVDVVEQRYRITNGAVAAVGQPRALLTLATPDTSLGLATDGAGRRWVAGPRGGGDIVFVVVARR
jgi:sugar lactone lactonase YvrE